MRNVWDLSIVRMTPSTNNAPESSLVIIFCLRLTLRAAVGYPPEPAIAPPEPVTQAPVAVAASAEPVASPKPVEVGAAESKPIEQAPKATPQPKVGEMASVEVPKRVAADQKTTPVPTGAWRVQLGAFNDRASAEATYRKLADNGVLAGRSPQYIPFNQFIRLRIGPFESKDTAAAACNALRVPCFPVAPGK